MGIRFPSGSGYEKIVDQLVAAEKIPVDQLKHRKDKVVDEKKEVEKLQGLLADLDKATNSIKTQTDFYKLKIESSHPDIIEGTVKGAAMLGSYEFEVRGLAKTDKQLAYGFPDKDKTAVGFGYMQVEREDKEPAEIVIEPGSTLEKVVNQINDAGAGVRAMVINTGYTPDSFRLLVVSEKSGKEARINLDADTTYLDFKNQVTGRNLDVLFEDVPVTSETNNLDALVENVAFRVKRAEAGTRVQLTVTYDMDATLAGVKSFVEKYNNIVHFAADQSKNPKDGEPGKLSGDSSVRQIQRQLQQALFPGGDGGKFHTLADVGITTNPKTGELQMDEAKVRGALTDDYEGVAQLFIKSRLGDGVGQRIADRIKDFRDPQAGVLKSRLRGLDSIIETQNKDITKKERQLGDKQESIKRRFAALENQMSGLNAQSSFLAQKFGGDGSQGGG